MIFNIYARTDDQSDLPADDTNVSGNLGTYDADFTSERFFNAQSKMKIMGNTLNVGKRIQKIKDSIILYMPDDISVNYKANYEGADIGLAVAAGASLGDLNKGNMTGGDVGKGLGMQFAKFIEPVLNFGSLTTAE